MFVKEHFSLIGEPCKSYTVVFVNSNQNQNSSMNDDVG